MMADTNIWLTLARICFALAFLCLLAYLTIKIGNKSDNH